MRRQMMIFWTSSSRPPPAQTCNATTALSSSHHAGDQQRPRPQAAGRGCRRLAAHSPFPGDAHLRKTHLRRSVATCAFASIDLPRHLTRAPCASVATDHLCYLFLSSSAVHALPMSHDGVAIACGGGLGRRCRDGAMNDVCGGACRDSCSDRAFFFRPSFCSAQVPFQSPLDPCLRRVYVNRC